MSDFGFYSGPAKSFDDSTEEDSDMESVFSEVSPIAVANGGTEETKNEVGLDDSDIWGDDEDGVVGAEEQEAKRKLKVEEMSSAMLIELSGTPEETEDAEAVAYVDDQEMKKARKRLQQIEKALICFLKKSRWSWFNLSRACWWCSVNAILISGLLIVSLHKPENTISTVEHLHH